VGVRTYAAPLPRLGRVSAPRCTAAASFPGLMPAHHRGRPPPAARVPPQGRQGQHPRRHGGGRGRGPPHATLEGRGQGCRATGPGRTDGARGHRPQ
jgi:hypothetical protein